MIQELLQKLGLSEKEIQVYLALFEQGKTTPARLAKTTSINRSTVYVVLEKLKEKGLVIEDVTAKTLYVSPSSAEKVEEMFYHQQEELKEKKKIALMLAEELEKMPQSKQYSIPKIRFVEEIEIEEFLYGQISKWDQSSKSIGHTCWGFQDKSFAQHYLAWVKSASEKYQMKINLLSNESELEKKLKKEYAGSRGLKYWSKELDFSASTWVMGDYLVMIVTRQHPFYLVEIHDAVMAHNMREVFKKIWNETV
ncbi:MAG: helix-turn-helix domain-containing protein [Candidatus Moraniibacteriota bacterium]